MSASDNKQKGGIMKKFIFFTYQFAFITITVNEDGDIVKMFWFQPGTSGRRLELINPKIMIDGGIADGPFLPFSEFHWSIGGNFKIAAQDIFTFNIRPKNIPTCNECGIFPVFEHIGYWSNGRKFSQGFNLKCTACEGLEDEPMPFVSEAMNIGKAIRDAIDAALNFSEEEGDDPDFV